MSTLKLPGVFLTLVLAIAPTLSEAQSPHRARIMNLKPLNILVGDWDLTSAMIPLNAPRITERGTMHCSSLYDSTYLECDVELTNGKGSRRHYKQFITYNPDSTQFEILYLYSGTPMMVLERGTFNGQALITRASIPHRGEVAEILHSSFKLTDRDNLYYESRSSVTNGEVDYTCTYSRKK